MGRLPETEGDKPVKKRFKPYPIGYFQIDIAEVRTEQGKLYLFVAIDRTSNYKLAFAGLHEKATRHMAGDFLRHLNAAVPYRVHTELTDNYHARQHGFSGAAHQGRGCTRRTVPGSRVR